MSHMTTYIDWTGLLSAIGRAMDEDGAWGVRHKALGDMERIETTFSLLTRALRARAQDLEAKR